MKVRLCLTTSLEVQRTTKKYATLSYCWGGPQDFQLNVATVAQLMQGVQISSMPKTLSDAVRTTWGLGVQWIWMDSLCIPQDNDKGKALEMAQMYLIYRNSFITISAARSHNVHQGFLHPCSLPFPNTIGFSLPYASPSGRPGSFLLTRGVADAPIDQRSWPLQEHLLAHRVLRFTDFRLHWSCASASMYEGISKQDLTSESLLPYSHIYHIEKAYQSYQSLRSEDRNCNHWMSIVEQYMNRYLSEPTDKLPAMSGLAESWDPGCKDKYLAGLWGSHLPIGLLWSNFQPHLTQSSTVYRAPSWSWASVDGQIDYSYDSNTETDPGLLITSCVINSVYENASYGAVKSGYLKLCGSLQFADHTVPEWTRNATAPVRHLVSYQLQTKLDLRLANVHPDAWDDVLVLIVDNALIYALQICPFDETSGYGPTGLILATRDDEIFWRIGMFEFEPPHEEDLKNAGDLEQTLAVWEDRKTVQRRAFVESMPRHITLV